MDLELWIMFGLDLLGKVFGTEKALTGIVDSVTNGLDKLVYTDEEKAEDAKVDRSEARKMVVRWMEATQGQNLARRLIALLVTGMWALYYSGAMMIGLVAIWTVPETSEKLIEMTTILHSAGDDMSGPFMLVLGFYFAAPHMGGIASAVIGRFTGKDHPKRDG